MLHLTQTVAELNFSALPQTLTNGILNGAIYALVALGYTMVYGVLRLINFAHGEVFMLGAYVALLTSYYLGYGPTATGAPTNPYLSLAIMILLAMSVCAVIGVVIERFAYRPMRNQPRIASLITAIGVSLLLQYGGALFLPVSPPPSIKESVNPFTQPVTITLTAADSALLARAEELKPAYLEAKQKWETQKAKEPNEFELSPEGKTIRTEFQEKERDYQNVAREADTSSKKIIVPTGKLIMLSTSVVLMILLWWLVTRTRAGRAMRAVSHDFDSASLMGIDVNKIVTLTFIIGSSLAGAAAMMLATFQGTPLTTFFGVPYGVKAFVAAVLGGIGNIPGAVVGGIVMGIAEDVVIWAGYSEYKDAVALVILIIVLLFRPGGILGSAKVEKV